MTVKLKDPKTTSQLNTRYRFTPSHIALITMWLPATVSDIVMLFYGVRNTDQFRSLPYFLQIAYVATLLWYLSGIGASIKHLPDLNSILKPERRIGKFIPLISHSYTICDVILRGRIGHCYDCSSVLYN